MKTQLIPMLEYQARRHVCKIGNLMSWCEGVVYINWFAPPCRPELAEVLMTAHQFRDSHSPIDAHPDAPALKMLDALLTHVFPQPTWEGQPEREITTELFNTWVEASELYQDWICDAFDYIRHLQACGVPERLAYKATSIRMSGAPVNDDDQEIVRQVAELLRRHN